MHTRGHRCGCPLAMSVRKHRRARSGPADSDATPATPATSEAEAGNSGLPLWIQPRAAKDAVIGERQDMVAIHLQAPPVDGAANAALIRFLASRLGCPAASVRLLRGERGRRKWVAVEGLTASQLRRRLLQA